jgi:predicted porin
MKKSILAIAVASLAASSAAIAEPTVYGNLHISLNQADNDVDGADNNLKVSSNTSAIGVKGSEDLGNGLKAIYKAEFQILAGPGPQTNPDAGGIYGSSISTGIGVGDLTGRDQFVGLKGGWGTVKFGTMSSNYKQMGGKVDALYRTPMEGRGFIQTQSSALHGGKGINRGRQTHTAQYVTPTMGGFSLVANTTFSGTNEETNGIGVRWSNKAFTVYADWIDGQPGAADFCDSTANCTTESAMKLGGKFSAKAFMVALQYEDAEDRTGANYVHAQGAWNINANNALILTYGMQDRKEAAGAPSDDSTGMAVAYNHKMSKMTNVYVGYGARSEDADGEDVSMLSFGIRKKF